MNKKVNCWDTLTGNAEGNQQPSLWMPRPGAMRRFIDYPEREYPSSLAAIAAKARGSTLAQE